MRIIKFRAWDKSQNYMAYQGKPDLETLQSFIFHFGDEILMQFTGLHDKNGKEIYEGDIILFQTFSNWDDESMKRHKATVIFKEGCFMWEILEFGKKSETYYANKKEPLRNTNSIWGLEVIGNIYENPELLENKFAH